MKFKKIFRIKAFYILLFSIISFIKTYDTSLLKINYFKGETNLIYINSFSNSKGDLYMEYYGNQYVRHFYGLNSTTGREILFDYNSILDISFSIKSTFHPSIIINYKDNENYIFSLGPDYFDFIDINLKSSSTIKANDKIDSNNLNSPSPRNNIIKLKDNNYLFSMVRFPILANLFIYYIKFDSNSFNDFTIIDKYNLLVGSWKSTSCIQTENQILVCLYNDKLDFGIKIGIVIFVIKENKLNGKKTFKYEEIKRESFVKLLHIKEEIFALIYFSEDNNIPRILVKYIDNLEAKNQFNFDYLDLNGEGKYSLTNDLFLSDGIKINNLRFAVFLTCTDLIHILIYIFDIYNNDQSLKIRYYYLDLDQINVKISNNINAFLFRKQIGITFYDYNKQYPGYIIFNYPNVTNEDLYELYLFKDEPIYNFSLYDSFEISNNILEYELIKIKVVNFSNMDNNGIFLFSQNSDDLLYLDEELYINDTIIFKESTLGSIPGVYSLELIPIIQELDVTDSDENNTYNIYNGDSININYIVDLQCNFSYHRDLDTKETICYENEDYCFYEKYKYHLNDQNECSHYRCPSGYYQFNFECYKNECPPETIQKGETNICQSIYNYCFINEIYQNECSDIKNNEYIYSFNNTNQYLKSCNESLIYTTNNVKTYLYNDICWIDCPENTIKDEENGICSCLYYKKEFKENNSYICLSLKEKCKDKVIVVDINECEDSLDSCLNKGYKIINNECYKNYTENESLSCPNLYYIEPLSNNQICIQNENCIEFYPYEDPITHECKSYCSPKELIDKDCFINNIFSQNDLKNIIENLKQIINEIGDNEDIVIRGKNIIFEIKSSEIKNIYNDISYIDFGECAKKIYEQNNINYFYIFKYELKLNDSLSPIVEYEIFHPEEKTKLNLSIYENEKVKISFTLDIEDQELINKYKKIKEEYDFDIFDKNDKFYNDICSTFTSDDKTDMILSDRRETYYKDLDEYCQDDCECAGYNITINRIICECPIKNEMDYEITKIDFDKNDISSFLSISTYANFAPFKCHNQLFSKKGIKNNFFSYLFIILCLLYILFMILFYFKYELKIQILLNSAFHNNSKINTPPKKDSQIILKLNNNINSKNIKIDTNDNNLISSQLNDNSLKHDNSINNCKENKRIVNIFDKTYIYIDVSFINKKELNYNDEELNSLIYEKAIKFDKRKYKDYYICLIKKKNSILFTFFRMNDFNILYIKIILFLISFSLYFVVNALFFTDITMHKIYVDKGIFNVVFQLPKILYSTIISLVINELMKFLALTESDILKLREKIDSEFFNDMLKKKYLCIKIRLNIFCVVGFLFMIFFWYYISCFCATYKNTIVIFLDNTIISYCISLIYPIILSSISGLFRICSLKKGNKKFMYTLSRIVAWL